jgi:hypothetical protein
MPEKHSAAVARYLQFRVREWVASGKSARGLAASAGISGAQVSDLMNQGVGAGWKTTKALATVFGMSVQDLITVAEEWAQSQPAPLTMPGQATKRRAAAADLAREDGVSEEAIDSVLSEPLRESDEKRSTLYWALRMKRRELSFDEPVPRTP